MDLPGYGLTGPFPDRDYSIDHYLDFLRNLLTFLGVKKCVLGGNSLGGAIAWSFTAKYPEMVDKLILIDASGYPSKAQSIPLAFKLAQVPAIKNIFMFITPRFVVRASVENVFAESNICTCSLLLR